MGVKLIWGGRVMSGLLAGLLTMSAAMKLIGGRKVIEGVARMGLPESLRPPENLAPCRFWAGAVD
ncbi:MAG TPA: hypothetical protein PK224_15750 [Nitrospira sp.]|nr:hypothetical protein [Nitrospira sp.]